MKNMLKLLLVICFPICSFAQITPEKQERIDILRDQIETAETDSALINSMLYLANEYFLFNPDTALIICHSTYEIAKDSEDKIGLSNTLGWLAYLYQQQGKLDQAIEYYKESLELSTKAGGKASSAITLNNIGYANRVLGNLEEARKCYLQSMQLRLEIKDTLGLASSYNNIGSIFKALHNQDSALFYLNKALNMYQYGDRHGGKATTLGNIAEVLKEKGQYEEAIDYFKESIELSRKVQDLQTASGNLIGLGRIYELNENLSNAIAVYEEAYSIAEKLNYPLEIGDASAELERVYQKVGKWEEALEMHLVADSMQSILKSKENEKAAIQERYQREYTIKHASDSIRNIAGQQIKDAEIAQQNIELEANKKEQWMLYGGLTLIVLFTFFVYNRLRITRQQKSIIEKQKEEVEKQKSIAVLQKEELTEKNREIVDSINYAKRIQIAILPPQRLVKEWLNESFILYKPKDIVAGDFYWMEIVNDVVYFASADCTGHGVPGAMVSVVCSNALTKALIEENIIEPAKILDRTRELVIDRFERSEEEVKDGMDIALCSLNINTNELQYSGANNPLWLIRNNTILETKASKQPIGKYTASKPFANHIIQLEKGDAIYIFTDGFADQFGGERGKKFKAKAFKELLLSNQNVSMPKQRTIINNAFEKWRGDLEQVDDVCVIGVKI